jgi:hypothetical protein
LWVLTAKIHLLIPEFLLPHVVTGVGAIQIEALLSSALSGDHTCADPIGMSSRTTKYRCLRIPEQTAIATILSDMDAEIAALEAKLAKARRLKQGMMQELLTGRIRLWAPSASLTTANQAEGAQASWQPGSNGTVLQNKLGILDPVEMAEAELVLLEKLISYHPHRGWFDEGPQRGPWVPAWYRPMAP